MTYVTYGFAKDIKLLKEKFAQKVPESEEKEQLYITSSACFWNFLSARSNYKAILNSPVMYKLQCNKELLEEVIAWIHENTQKIKIDLVHFSHFGYYTATGRNVTTVDKDTEGVISLGYATVAIYVDSEDWIPKSLLEYLLLVLIRIIDVRESYVGFLKETDAASMGQRLLDVSFRGLDGHSIYEGNKKFFNEKKLIMCLDIDRITKRVKESKLGRGLLKMAQTSIINFILEGAN